MKTFYVTLTSEQLPPLFPSILDHWLFVDPVSGEDYPYPNTADGSIFPPATSVATETYTAFVCGGNFFPWGYQVVDQTQVITLPDLKGDTTIVFVTSGIDITYHDVLKIAYDPGNGEDPLIHNRSILTIPADFSDNAFYEISESSSPTKTNQSFTYNASSSKVTYYPGVTALYGDMTRLFYKFIVNIYPNSVFDIDNVHLITASKSPSSKYSATCVYEVESVNALSLNVVDTSIAAVSTV